MASLIEIGRIIKPQGVRGELKVLPSTNVESAFSKVKEVVIDGKTHKVSHFNFRFGFAYLQIPASSDRNVAETFRGKKVLVSDEVFDDLGEDTYLTCDLVGMGLFDEANKFIGRVKDVENYGATDILIIDADGRDYQVPFIKDVFLRVDVVSKQILVSKKHFDMHKVI